MTMRDTEASPATETETPALASAETQDSAAIAAPDANADPSPADEKQAPKSLLDVLQDAVKPEAPEDTSPPDPTKSEAGKENEGELPELTDEELAKLPFGKHPRFKELTKQRGEFKAQAEELTARVEELTAPAEQFRSIDTFLRSNEIVPDEFVRLMKIGALVKQDPEEARKEVLQVLFELDDMTGRRLPDALKADVEEGRITEERAFELSQAQAAAARERERRTAVEERVQTTSSEDAQARHLTSLGDAVAAWETRLGSTDPNFAEKAPFVADRVKLLNTTQGLPKTPEEAVQRAQTAYQEVSQQLARALPKRPEIKRSPESGSSSSAAPAPKTLFEAISRAV